MRKGKINSEEGQSTIEFLISFVLVFGFIFLFLRLALVYTNGYLVHYAVFMASRAYMIGETNSQDVGPSDTKAKKNAESVLTSLNIVGIVNNFQNKITVHSPDAAGSDFDRNLYVGVWAEYNDEISIPGAVGAKKELTMRSESFLGIEPTRAECVERTCRAILDIGGDCINHATVADNGC